MINIIRYVLFVVLIPYSKRAEALAKKCIRNDQNPYPTFRFFFMGKKIYYIQATDEIVRPSMGTLRKMREISHE